MNEEAPNCIYCYLPMVAPCLTHPRTGELPRKYSALICHSCGMDWEEKDSEIVGQAWGVELKFQFEDRGLTLD